MGATKPCAECGEEVPIDEFRDSDKTRDGKHWLCEACIEAGDDFFREMELIHDRIYSEAWRKRNPIRANMKGHRWRTRRAKAPATLTLNEWEGILTKWNYSCAYCGKSWLDLDGEKLHQEHVIPVSQGGGYTADNIVPACPSCNSAKGGRTPEEADMPLLNETEIV